jgi:tetratricopeptide (TPR) repeat protein
MPKKTITLLFILGFCTIVKAQTADQVYDKFLDFNDARSHNNLGKTLTLGQQILVNVDKLPAKTKIYFYNALAKAYEDNKQFDLAVPYYETVAKAVPNYYVVHRALGYIYLMPADELYKKLQATKDKAAGDLLMQDYKKAVLKALPHLEKAQACDPSDETLTLIKSIYKNIKDNAGLKSLNSRLTALSKNCLDILTE